MKSHGGLFVNPQLPRFFIQAFDPARGRGLRALFGPGHRRHRSGPAGAALWPPSDVTPSAGFAHRAEVLGVIAGGGGGPAWMPWTD